MFLLEDGQMARDNGRPDKTRRADTLIAVLFSAAVIFYIILSLLSTDQASASPVSVSQTFYQGTAPTVGAGIPGNR
jgi:hypothetical protein